MKTGGHKGILCVYLLSLPVRGAWIEILNAKSATDVAWSLPVRGAWIEILNAKSATDVAWSLPVRGAWIEITCYMK